MRSLVDFLTYEVALGHWWLIIIGLFSRENMVCNMLCFIERLTHMFLTSNLKISLLDTFHN